MTALGRIDRYELIELLGQGSFGGVYRARHVHTGQIVALKLVRAADPDAAGRLLVEGRAASSLRHPNVVGILDGGLTETGDAFIVMELLSGETLAQLLARETRLAPERAVPIALAILDALALAHVAGIIHRDVKPSNVFLSSEKGVETVKVIDFGISKLRAPGATSGSVFTLPGVAMGTPGYMAPEQLGDARSVDARADVYSVGATLFELLAGRKPHVFDSFEVWMKKLGSEPAPPLASVAPGVSPALGAIVDRALARDRDARWGSAAAMREALQSAFAISSVAPANADATIPGPSLSSVTGPDPTLRVSARESEARAGPTGSAGAWAFAIAGVALAIISVVGVAAFLVGRAGRHSEAAPPSDAPLAPSITSVPPVASVPSADLPVEDTTTPLTTAPPASAKGRARTPHGIGY